MALRSFRSSFIGKLAFVLLASASTAAQALLPATLTVTGAPSGDYYPDASIYTTAMVGTAAPTISGLLTFEVKDSFGTTIDSPCITPLLGLPPQGLGCSFFTPMVHGDYQLVVTYAGDALTDAASQSFAFRVPYVTSIGYAGMPYGTLAYGAAFVVEATVTGAGPLPAGSVAFTVLDLNTEAQYSMCSDPAVPLDASAKASCNITALLPAGNYVVRMSYSGDASSGSSSTDAGFSIGHTVLNALDTPPPAASDFGSLRRALEDLNANCSRSNQLIFAIPGPGPHVISPGAQLPAVTCTGANIDGYTQPLSRPNEAGFGSTDADIRVVLDGASCFACDGLQLAGYYIGVRGLSIVSFTSSGIVASDDATIRGNFIGITPAGDLAPNSIGILAQGGFVYVGGSADVPADVNLVSGNTGAGIYVGFSSNASIAGNLIGGTAGGGPGNPNAIGILVQGAGTVIARNKVSFNSGAGIVVDIETNSVAITGNAAYDNGGPGIDLNGDGPTANDKTAFPYDVDSGGNGLQDYPVITSVTYSAGTTTVNGYLKTDAPGAYSQVNIELFSNVMPRTAITGGDNIIDSFGVTLDLSGVAVFSRSVEGSYDNISATATVDSCSPPSITDPSPDAKSARKLRAKYYLGGCPNTSEYSPTTAVTTIQGNLVLSATSLDFGLAETNKLSVATRTLTLSNNGLATVTFAASAFVVSSDYTIASNACGATLAPDTTCQIILGFQPSAGGVRPGTLTITSDSPGSPHVVSLTGIGVDPPQIQIVTASTQVTGTTNSVTVRISNVSADADLAGFAGALTYPAGFVNSATPAPRGTCGASVTAIVSGNVMMANGGSAAKSVTCDLVTADVIAPAPGTYSFSIPAGAISMTTPFNWSNPAPITFTVVVVTAATPVLTVSPASLAFPTTALGTTSAGQKVTFSNTGSVSVVIASAVVSSGPFSATGSCSGPLAPGGSCSMNVVFAPSATGPASGSFTVTSNASGSPHSITLTGTGAPPPAPGVGLSAASLTFAARTIATTSPPQSVTLTNTGTAPLGIGGVAISGDFAFTSACPKSLAPGASCAIDVTFTPLITGTRAGSLAISTNAPGSPHLVALNGAGLSTAVGTLDVSPSSLDFGAQTLNHPSAPQLLFVANVGSAAVNITAAAPSGDFGLDDVPAGSAGCGGSLAPGATCFVNVAFVPTALGARAGVLHIASDASNPSIDVALSGVGVAAAPQRALNVVDALAFGAQPFGTRSAGHAVVLANVSGQPVVVSDIDATGDFSVSESCAAIPAGGSCTATVFFTPSARGSRSGSLTIRIASETAPYVVTLSGDGTANPVAILRVSPTRIGFGNAFVGTISTAAIVTLSNVGEARLLLDGLTAPGDFDVASHCGSFLDAGTSCVVDVRFFARMLGARDGLLEIRSNAAGSPHFVDLSGTGCAIPNVGRSRIPQLLCGP